jgi:hypothetical protein
MAELRNRLEPATDRLVAEARRQIEHDKHLLS